MTRTKKILLGLLVALLLLLVAGFLVANHLLNSYSAHFLDVLARRGKKHGVVVSEPVFRSAGITGLRSAKWNGLYAELEFPDSEAFDPKKKFEVRISRLDGLLASGQVTLVADELAIDAFLPADEDDSDDTPASQERVTAKRVQCSFPMSLSDPLPGLEAVVPELVRLMRDGRCDLPVLATGVLEFQLNDKPVQLGLRVEAMNGAGSESYRLVLSEPDLHAVSDQFDEPLTEAEVTLLADNPLRAGQLLRIKNDAETTAENAKTADASVPQDAYRHVLWSFLLTNKYDAAFAKRVTDSHEEGDTGNSPAEREMDYNNNQVGRQYAELKVRRAEILGKIKSDPMVVLEPK